MAVTVFIPTLHATPEVQSDSPRERLPFNRGWLFSRNDPPDAGDALVYERIKDWLLPCGDHLLNLSPRRHSPLGTGPGEMRVVGISYTLADYDDSRWRKLNLPHDWGIEGPFHPDLTGKTAKLPWFGVAWYRKHFALPAIDTGRHVYLDLDGAMAYATVWINGIFAGGWPYGYTSWRVDLTPYIKFGGENTLAIRLDNPRESSRWYPGGGIYRNVWLVKTAPVHIAQWGVRVTTPVITNDSAVVNVAVTIDNKTGNKSETNVITKIYQADHAGLPVGQAILQSSSVTARIEAGEQAWVSHSLVVPSPRLWSLETRNRYVAETDITRDSAIIDRVRTPFGIRAIQHTAGNGFLLNGKRVPIRGVCMHHDLGALGTAINFRAMERQLEILHEMGCNAIRTSHNPPAPELLELCDRMGFLVQAEAFDCWASGKVRDDYSRLFPDWHEKDLRSMVRRDRNHPCVIQWSIGNEIREQGSSGGRKLAAHLAGIVREDDRSRPVVAGFNLIQSGYNGMMTAADIVGYNYKPFEYSKIHRTHPQYPILGTETASTISSRGEYVFPVSENKLDGRNKSTYQVSSYDLYAPKWGSTPDTEWRAQDENPSVMGEFVWTGFDYLGEPTPYNSDTTNLLNFATAAESAQAAKELDGLAKVRAPSRSSYFGIVDLAGFPKDRYYLYQSRWRPGLPMAHILPHWNWPGREGQITPVHVYSSGDEAELFLNGNSLGRKKRGAFEYRFRWDDVVYSPGELKVAVWKNGKPWTETVRKTTGSAAKLLLTPDRAQLRADGADLVFVTVTVADKDGLPVPRAQNSIRFSVTGPAEIAAVDNGDATSFAPFQGSERAAYNGFALVISRTKPDKSGILVLRAESDGLEPAAIELSSK
ncbi:beta-galactosidase [Termitidicoccus mucosus]|uniref:Beta-galactosidase n=2 Tax=Termitidicoccus mucosus TaxID=1184151 RepID=A0A178IMT1_9BACT|nr:beta-galactosidase [Opitutaceae bacterium TSB47]